MDLKLMMEKYLGERMEFEGLSVSKTARLYDELIGPPSGLNFPGIGFVRFLRANGISEPTVDHMSREWIGGYRDYLEQYHGIACLKPAFSALEGFWRWCANNSYFATPIEPPGFAVDETPPSFRVSVRLSRRSS